MGSPRAGAALPAEFSALRVRLRDLDERVAAERAQKQLWPVLDWGGLVWYWTEFS